MHEMMKKWRKEANMTQEELANRLFLTPQAISLLENGNRTLQFELFQEIANVFQKEIILYTQDKATPKEITNITIKKTNAEEIQTEFINQGIIGISKEDFDTILSIEGKAYHTKTYRESIDEAIRDAFQCFCEGNIHLHKAKGILVYIEGSNDFTYEDLDKLSKKIDEHTNSDAFIIFGCDVNGNRETGCDIHLLAIGF